MHAAGRRNAWCAGGAAERSGAPLGPPGSQAALGVPVLLACAEPELHLLGFLALGQLLVYQ